MPPPVDEGKAGFGAWTRGDIDRLIAGERTTWDRVVKAIEGFVAAASRSWSFSTLEADAVRDHVQDVLLVSDMRRLREFRDPGAFAAYLAKVTRNRASYVARHRPKVVTQPLDVAEKAFRRIADARPQAEYSLHKEGPAEYRAALGRAILQFREALSNRRFSVLWLCHVEGQPTALIADALKITPRGVRKLHDSAISAVRRARSGQIASESQRGSFGQRPDGPDSGDHAAH